LSSIPARRALGPTCLFFYHCAVLVSDELLVLPLSRKLLVRSIGFQRKKGRLQGQGKSRTIPDWHQQVSFLSSSSSRFETWAQSHHRGHPHPHFRHRSCHPCQKQLFMVGILITTYVGIVCVCARARLPLTLLREIQL
jgi:hypothetical protein